MATVCYDRYGRGYYCNSRWNSWGRWVALAVIVIAAIILFFIIACLSQRRRRKAGRQPFYGTGWTSKFPGGAPPPYQPNYPQQQGQQQYGNHQGPQYNSTPAGGYYGQNQSYFGGQRDVEMQPPQNVYNNQQSYAPPPGPPPSKIH